MFCNTEYCFTNIILYILTLFVIGDCLSSRKELCSLHLELFQCYLFHYQYQQAAVSEPLVIISQPPMPVCSHRVIFLRLRGLLALQLTSLAH